MTINLEPTGERMIEAAYFKSREAYTIYVMHAASYAFAERYCHGKRVLDLGCGSGYGVNRLSSVAESIVGVDVSEEAVAFAREAYPRGNSRFEIIEPNGSLPFERESFDVVLSFQVIEHVEDELHYLREAHRVLKSGGTLVVITPDRTHRLLPGQRPWNRWHLREYSLKELTSLIGQIFDVSETLRMGASNAIASTELRRYRWTKWTTLPFTLPGTPEVVRQFGLNFLHSFRGKHAPVQSSESKPESSFGFDESAVQICSNPPNPLNLVIVAKCKDKGASP